MNPLLVLSLSDLIIMIMKIRFDYFFSWFDKSGQKDAAAKFSIKQFYAFVINGVSFTL